MRSSEKQVVALVEFKPGTVSAKRIDQTNLKEVYDDYPHL